MIFRITDDDDTSSAGFDLFALGDAFHGIVRTFGMKIGADFANECAHIFFWKDDYCINIGQRCQNFSAFRGRHHGPSLPLQRAYRVIGVQRDNQFAPESAGGMKIAYVADVQQVETSVGKRDAITGLPPTGHALLQFVARNNLLMV